MDRPITSPPASTMDVNKAISAYIERMVKEVAGLKILLLDDHTVRLCTSAC